MKILNSISRTISDNGWAHFLLTVPARVGDRVRSGVYSRIFGARVRINRHSVIRGVKYISLSDGFTCGDGLWMEAVSRHGAQTFHPRIIIGCNFSISQWGHIAATNEVRIGNDVLVGSKVIISDHSHGDYSRTNSDPATPPARRPLTSDQSITIGDNVWIADGVVITPGTVIGNGSIVAANSVVKGVVPPNVIVAGAPARVVRQFDANLKAWVKASDNVAVEGS